MQHVGREALEIRQNHHQRIFGVAIFFEVFFQDAHRTSVLGHCGYVVLRVREHGADIGREVSQSTDDIVQQTGQLTDSDALTS